MLPSAYFTRSRKVTMIALRPSAQVARKRDPMEGMVKLGFHHRNSRSHPDGLNDLPRPAARDRNFSNICAACTYVLEGLRLAGALRGAQSPVTARRCTIGTLRRRRALD